MLQSINKVLILSLFIVTKMVMASPVIILAAPQISAKGYVLIDADNGKIIIESNADERL